MRSVQRLRTRASAPPGRAAHCLHACRCHVMEAESFEDEETARLMNASFINVKVDREERPDVDKVYVSAPPPNVDKA